MRVREGFGQLGELIALALRVVRLTVRDVARWWPGFVDESLTIVRRCTIPLIISVFAFGFGTIGVQAGQILDALGASDRTGAIYVVGAVRELATWATAMIVAGVAGTAACADLGARKVRDELDALSVLGVDPVRSLVVPRVLAFAVMTPLLNLVAIMFTLLSGVIASMVIYDTSVAAFAATLKANFAVPELLGAVAKTFAFGVIIGVVSCYRGLNTGGGPVGVGRAVNQAVVVTFATLWIFNYVWTSLLLSTFPSLLEIR